LAVKLKKFSTSFLVIATVTILLVFAFQVRIAATADSVAVLRTTGMTCSSCSSKVTSALQSLKGVAVTEVDVEGGWVVVGYDTKTVKPESLAEKVSGTGFNSKLAEVLTPEQFKQRTGRAIGQNTASASGCCGKGGCGTGK
jgi:periplasmic mercuric ion binding protein